MIALDTSAIVAIAMEEAEGDLFEEIVVARSAIVAPPTLLEARMVLTARVPDFAPRFLDNLVGWPSVTVVPFTLDMYRAASDAFLRFGKGRGHRAQLNFGDCLAYAVARTHAAPLLFKGDDFVHTDIEPAHETRA
ncbi:type II toxin-antitoxin system VapC family toxin [Methylobacterium oxalidis]|uniref:Ribonuclease VapC n=1 Tax=Methylobacterium oxalidis TaxID=944322 RepID=A0A512J6R2_9HYPH|nr:type II toxin-antitoxin system VapC family toxin [Methylobacterium oxalidis]GEP05658.1 ribonuclease VapC [Methylobacterium oxalidis]GJE32463.1 Ribonuclease VapC42 [Methylobacterium oxalidis]GLS63137.1 ribonuclease VapC [Methylobacterium oxalidis]